MGNMNPKTILSPRNIIGALLIAVTAAVLFSGTWIVYNEFVKAAPGDGEYTADDGGGASMVLLEFASDPNEADNVTSCPGGLPGGAVCYNTSVITNITPAQRTGVNIGIVAKGSTLGAPPNTAIVIFDDINALDQDLGNYSISVTNLGGITATINNVVAGGGGGGATIEYFQQNPDFANVTTFHTSPLTAGQAEAIVTTNETAPCPEGPAYNGLTCMKTSLASFTNDTGLAGGAAISAIVIAGPDNSDFLIVMNNPDLIVDNQALELTVSAFNNVAELITADFQPDAGGGGGPVVEYAQQDPNYSDVTTVQSGPLTGQEEPPITTTDQTVACPGGGDYDGKTCLDTSLVSFTNDTGLAGGAAISALVVSGPNDNELTVVMNNPDLVVDNQDLEITFSTFNNVTELVVTNFQPPPGGGDPEVGSYVQAEPTFSATTFNTISLSLTSGSTITTDGNTVACPGGPEYTDLVCLDLSLFSFTNDQGIAGGGAITAVFVAKGTELVVVMNGPDLVEDNTEIEFTINTFNNVKPHSFSDWELDEEDSPEFVTYISNAPEYGGSVLMSPELSDGTFSGAGGAACPGGDAYTDQVCFNVAGVTNLSGTSLAGGIDANDVVAIVENQDARSVKVVMNAPDVITDLGDLSITFNNFGGIAEPLEYTDFSVGVAADYTAKNSDFGNNSTLGIWMPIALDAGNTIDCNSIGIAEGGAVCYNADSVTAKSGITGNITGLVRGDLSDIDFGLNYVVAILDTDDAVADTNNASITLNNFGGVAEPQERTTFVTIGGGDPPSPPSGTGTYMQASPAFSATVLTTPILDFTSGSTITSAGEEVSCPGGAGYDQKVCLDTNLVSFTNDTDLAGGGAITAVFIGENSDHLVIVLNDVDLIEGPNIEITVSAFNNVSEKVMSTWAEEVGGGGQPTNILFNPHLSFQTAILTVETSTIANKTDNTVACDIQVIKAALNGSPTCYDTSTATVNGLAGGITVDFILQGDSTIGNFGYTDGNLIIGLSDTNPVTTSLDNLSVDLANTGSVTESFNDFQQNGINYAQYKNTDADWSDMTTAITAPLTAGAGIDTSGLTTACPVDAMFDGKTCLNQTGFDFTGGDIKQTASLDAIVVGNTGNQLILVWDDNNVIIDKFGLSLEVPQLDIAKPATLGNFIDIGGGGGGGGENKYQPFHEFTGTSVMLLGGASIDAGKQTACNQEIQDILGFFAGGELVCYQNSLVTNVSGDSLQGHISANNVWALVDQNTIMPGESGIAVIFSMPDIAFGTDSLSITVDGTAYSTWGWDDGMTEDDWDPVMMGSDDNVWFQGSFIPWEVGTNLKTATMMWSGPLNTATVNTSVFKLYDSDWNSKTISVTSTTLESGETVVDIALPPVLSDDTEYMIVVDGLKDAKGNDLNYEQLNFWTNSAFNTDSGSQMMYSWPGDNESGIDPLMPEIGIGFDYSKPITSTGTGTITPSVSGTTYEIDPMYNEILVYLGEALANNTEYTVSFPNVTDAYGFTSSAEITFTTGQASTDAPQINWVDFYTGTDSGGTIMGGEVTMGFNMALNSAAKEGENWTLVCDGGATLPSTTLEGKAVEYNSNEWMVTIFDPGIPENANNCTITAGAAIKGLNNVAFSTNESTGPPMQEFSYFDETWAGDFGNMMDFGCMGDCGLDDKFMDAGFMAFGGMIEFEPSTTIAGKVAEEIWFSTSISQELKTGYILEITLPSGATLDDSKLEIHGQYNINGKVIWFDSDNATYSSTTKKIKIPIKIDSDGDGNADTGDSGGKLSNFQLDGIIGGSCFTNPATASEYDWETGNGGGYAVFGITDSLGKTTESIGNSTPYSVGATGDGTISGKVINSATSEGVEGVPVFVESWKTGEFETTTASDGTYSFTGLPTAESVGSSYGVDYFVGIDPKEGYVVTTADNFIYLDSSNKTETNLDFNVNPADVTASVTFTTPDHPVKNDLVVEAFNWMNNQFAMKEITIPANQTETVVEIGISNGDWEICAHPDQGVEMKGGGGMDMGTGMAMHMMIPCVNIYVGEGESTTTASIGVEQSDGTINVTATDTSGSAISNTTVFAYNPWSGMGGGDCTTNDQGTCSINVVSNEQYTVLMDRNGSMQEKSVYVPSGDPVSVTFQGKSQGIVISGNVLAEGSSSAWIQTWDDWGFYAGTEANTETGAWALSVPDNTTLYVEAWGDWGQLTGSGVYVTNGQHEITISGDNVSSINFVKDSANSVTLSGSTSPAIEGMTICADERYISTGEYGYNFNCTSTNSSGEFSLVVAKTTGTTAYEIIGYSMNYGDLYYDSWVEATTDVSNIVMSAGDMNEVTINITGNPGLNEAFLDIFDPNTGRWAGQQVMLSNLSSKTVTLYVDDGTYDVWLWTQLGGFNPSDSNGNPKLTINEDTTINFTLGEISNDLIEMTVTVVDPGGDPVENAWVEAFDYETNTFIGGETDSSGEFTDWVAPGSNLKIRADHWNYSSKKISVTKEELETNPNVALTLGGQKSSTITINVTTGSGSSVTDFWGDVTDGEFWNGAPLIGATQIAVPDLDGELTVFINAINGDYLETTASVGDTVSVTYPTDFTTGADWLGTDAEPAIQSGDENGVSLKDTDNGIELDASTGLLNGDFTITAQTVGNLPGKTGGEVTPLLGKQIILKDANGTVTTDTSATYNTTFTMDDNQLEGMIANNELTIDGFAGLNIGYWSANNTWVVETTSRTAEVKLTSGDSWTAEEMTTLITNLKANTDYYYDYRIKLTAIGLDHFTIFSPITGSDSTPPSAPTGLSGSATSSAVTLDWNDNSEGDLLEYEIYRSTTTPVPLEDANQVNTSAVTSSTFTDSTVTAGTTYYYAITAVDTSHNESTSLEANVAVPAEDDDTPVVIVITPSATGGGTASTVTSDDDDEEVEEAEEGEGEGEETSDESGWTSSEHDEIDEDEDEEEITTDYEDHWAKSYIETIIEAGIASGLDEYTFMPDNALTRAEMTKMIVLAFEYNIQEDLISTVFPDVDPEEWYAPYVEAAYVNGLVSGYPDGTFQPGNNINRAEAMKIIVEAYLTDEEVDAIVTATLPFPDVEPDAWYTPYITYGYLEHIVSGYEDGTYGPANNVTRAEFSKIISNLLQL